jgi:hypothetical protein
VIQNKNHIYWLENTRPVEAFLAGGEFELVDYQEVKDANCKRVGILGEKACHYLKSIGPTISE